MREMIRNTVRKVGRSEKGFTLIEMLVVVGIIVALAAVIVPTVIKFAGSGTEGALDAEFDAIQTAIDIMMTDQKMAKIDEETSYKFITNTTNFAFDQTQSQLIVEYFREASTQFCYKWADSGKLTEQAEPVDGNCPTT